MGLSVFWPHFSGRSYEQGQWRFAARFLEPGMTFFDIGANQGFYTILAAKRVGPTGRVFAFDPAPTEFSKLRWNLLLNRCRSVVREPQALGSHEGFTQFHLCLDHQGPMSSIRPPAADATARKKTITVPITTLDTYVHRNEISSIDLIKLDVEGGE
jgi:FkbM family methyltransferase